MALILSGDGGISGLASVLPVVSVVYPDASVQTTAPSGFGFKNRIINGDMRIDQRNAGGVVTTSVVSQYVVDRFISRTDTANGTAQRSTTAPVGFVNSIVFTSGTGASPSTSQVNTNTQRIEGFNVADFGWGTTNAQTITLSFWVQSSITGMFAFRIGNGTRSYVATYTISTVNTFEFKTITILGDTSGTWATDNSVGMYLNWDLGSGSSFNASSANTWLAGDFLKVSGATSIVGTSGATFYITGVQLEKGSTATSFDYRDYGRELVLCKRYYKKVSGGVTATVPSSTGYSQPGNTFNVYIEDMRTLPTVTKTTTAGVGLAAILAMNNYRWIAYGHNYASSDYDYFNVTFNAEL